MSDGTFHNTRVSISQRIGLLGLITTFLVMGTLRLNDCDLFNPDSPRYVLYSQSIVDLGEYRATDLPGSPVYTWRPPGLSMLLAPMMAIRPFDVVAAKAVVLMTGAILLWAVFHLTALHATGWEALCITALVASGPSFFIMSTEVLTEVPYAVGVVVVLTILSQSTFTEAPDQARQNGYWRMAMMILATVALAFTPWLRTAGIALVAAAGIWVAVSRARLQWVPVVAAAVVAFGFVAWRNKQAGGENYIGSMMTRLADHGLVPFIHSGLDTVWYYFRSIPGLLLPGFMTDRAWYSPVLLETPTSLGVPFVLAACLAATMVSLAFLGMCRRQANGGSLCLLYILIYGACLIVWPWRHERFLWPLMPIVMSFLPAGFTFVAQGMPRFQKGLAVVAAIVLLAFCGWQALGCGQLISVNRQFLSERDKFHEGQIPGFYYSNWRRAGEWLNANSPPSARVLTWHAAVGGTSRRFQKRVQFETLSPDKLRQQIEAFSARYLVVPDAQFGDGFAWHQVTSDPAIKLNVVYREQDVAILEVGPNRTGDIQPSLYDEWLERQLQSAEAARATHPHRVDLDIRCASLLREAGRSKEAIPILRGLVDRGVKTVRVCSELGWMYYEQEEYADAATYLDMARALPNAESMASTLAEAATRTRKRSLERKPAQSDTVVQRAVNIAKAQLNSLKFAAAEKELGKLEKLAPDHPELLFLRGQLHHRLNERDQAIVCYSRAIERGFDEAKKWLLEIQHQQTVATDRNASSTELIDPNSLTTYVTAAELSNECGWPGRALATLERANERFPDQTSIQFPLAELYRRFARPELAVPLYESVLNSKPNDETAQRGLTIVRAGLLEPQMSPRRKTSENKQYADTAK